MEYKFVLGAMSPMVAFFFSFIFIRLWLRNRDEWHILGFGVAFSLAGISIVHICLLAPGYTLGHGLVFLITCNIGMIVLNASLAKRLDIEPPMEAMAGLTLFGVVAMLVAAYATRDAFFRIYITDLTVGLQFAIGMWAARRANRTARRALSGSVSFILPMVILFASPWGLYAMEGPVDAMAYAQSSHWTAVVALAPLIIVIMSTNLLLTLSEDLTRQVREANQMDFLTGLATRQAFEEQARALFAQADDEGAAVTTIIADLDDFKRVNDTLGHHMGDLVIAAFGKALREAVREPHIVGRVGGEEFCIMLYRTDERAARLLATQLCMAFNIAAIEGAPEDTHFSASFGMAHRHEGENQMDLYRRADRALYLAKSSGKNRVVSCDAQPMTKSSTRAKVERAA